jgi:hypothetical protein
LGKILLKEAEIKVSGQPWSHSSRFGEPPGTWILHVKV